MPGQIRGKQTEVAGVKLMQNEAVLRDVTPAWTAYARSLLFGLILLLAGVAEAAVRDGGDDAGGAAIMGIVAFGAVAGYAYYRRSRTHYIVTDSRVVKRSGILLSKNTQEAGYEMITGVGTNESRFQSLFGNGTVEVATSGGVGTVELTGAPNDEDLANLIRSRHPTLGARGGGARGGAGQGGGQPRQGPAERPGTGRGQQRPSNGRQRGGAPTEPTDRRQPEGPSGRGRPRDEPRGSDAGRQPRDQRGGNEPGRGPSDGRQPRTDAGRQPPREGGHGPPREDRRRGQEGRGDDPRPNGERGQPGGRRGRDEPNEGSPPSDGRDRREGPGERPPASDERPPRDAGDGETGGDDEDDRPAWDPDAGT